MIKLPKFDNWNSVYCVNTLKIYLIIYLIIVIVSYFGRMFLPQFWIDLITNKRVKGEFCKSLVGAHKAKLKEWSSCSSCDTGCSCENCPIDFKRYLFRRVFIAGYFYLGFLLLKYLGYIPVLAILGGIGSKGIKLAKTWLPIILGLCCILPLFRLPLKTQYIFIGSDKVGFKELGNNSSASSYICGNSSGLESNVTGLAEAKNSFATACSVNAGKLVLYSLIPMVIVFLIFCLIVFIKLQSKTNMEVFESDDTPPINKR